MKEDLDFWIPETKSTTYGSRGSAGVRAWREAWQEVARYLIADDAPVAQGLGDVRRMTQDVPEGDAMDGWLACILYVEDRQGLDDDSRIRSDLRAILETHDMGSKTKRPAMAKRRGLAPKGP